MILVTPLGLVKLQKLERPKHNRGTQQSKSKIIVQCHVDCHYVCLYENRKHSVSSESFAPTLPCKVSVIPIGVKDSLVLSSVTSLLSSLSLFGSQRPESETQRKREKIGCFLSILGFVDLEAVFQFCFAQVGFHFLFLHLGMIFLFT